MPDHPLIMDAYCDRIGYRGFWEAMVVVVRNVLGRHAFAIPYYNLDVLLGRPVSIDPAAVEEKGVNTRRGGDGFEQSTLMKVLIGIKVAPLIADTLADTLEGSDPHQPFRGNLRIGPNLACPGLDGNV